MTARALSLTSQGGAHVVEAIVSRRAAALRALRVDGVDIVEPTTRSASIPGMSGVVLAPWPNRVEGARWRLDGVDQHLDVTEPELGNANHGLLAESDFDVVQHGADTLSLRADITGRPGYPFDLRIEVTYTVTGRGLHTVVGVCNLGSAPAPFATGAHPYLRIGDVPTSDLRVTVDADHHWPLSDAHLPRRRRRLAERVERAAFSTVPGHATYELAAPGARLRHSIVAPDGREVCITASPAARYTQVWVAPDLDADDGRRQAIAIEPMTAPPNALRNGSGLRWVAPGGRWEAGWTIERLT